MHMDFTLKLSKPFYAYGFHFKGAYTISSAELNKCKHKVTSIFVYFITSPDVIADYFTNNNCNVWLKLQSK